MKKQKITIRDLTQDGVTLITQNYIEYEGYQCNLGDPIYVSYRNTEIDRERVKKNVPEPYLTAIMAIWGDEPTIVTK